MGISVDYISSKRSILEVMAQDGEHVQSEQIKTYYTFMYRHRLFRLHCGSVLFIYFI